MWFDVVQAWSAAIQTALVGAGLAFGVYQVLRAEKATREAEAQTAYREYLAMAVDHPSFTAGDDGRDPTSQAQYSRFVTYALAACEKICDTALRHPPRPWTQMKTDYREWERSIDVVLSLHAPFIGNPNLFTEQALLTYSESLQGRIRAKFPGRMFMEELRLNAHQRAPNCDHQ